MPWILPIAMWLLAIGSLVTVAQRLHTVRTSAGATDKIQTAEQVETQETSET
jgi:hypothetical protein